MFAQSLSLSRVPRGRAIIGSLIVAAALVWSGFVGAMFAHAQTDTQTYTGTTPGVSADITVVPEAGLPNTGASETGVPDRSSWLILAVIVVVASLMIVGWGMGAQRR